jgi:hypothetical protein
MAIGKRTTRSPQPDHALRLRRRRGRAVFVRPSASRQAAPRASKSRSRNRTRFGLPCASARLPARPLATRDSPRRAPAAYPRAVAMTQHVEFAGRESKYHLVQKAGFDAPYSRRTTGPYIRSRPVCGAPRCPIHRGRHRGRRTRRAAAITRIEADRALDRHLADQYPRRL